MLIMMIALKFFRIWGKCYVLPEPQCWHVHIKKKNKNKQTKRQEKIQKEIDIEGV